jgi:ribosomal protein L16 Arg81 hydroxylase
MPARMHAFSKLIAPISPEVFFQEYWEKKPLVVRRDRADYYGDLLTLREFDRVLTTQTLHHPQCFLTNAARQVASEEYTFANGVIDPARLYQQFADGSTIVFNQLEHFIPPLAALCRSLEREISTRFQCNIYCTPSQAQGFPTHYDSHDVFVLQIHGTKHWVLYNTPIELPFKGQPFRRDETPKGEPTAEFDLAPGDLLYLPRGIMHDAQTTKSETLHITLGVLATSWTELLLEAVAKVALGDPDFRRTLPVGFARTEFDRTESRAFFRSLLQRVVERADFDAALDHFADDLVSTRHALLEGQMEQILRLPKLTVKDRAGARPYLVYRWRVQDGQLIVSCYGAEMRLPEHAAEPARYALETPEFVIEDLPGDLDDAGKLVLIRRLVREGMVRILS